MGRMTFSPRFNLAATCAIVATACLAALAAHAFGDTPTSDLPLFAATLAATGWFGLLAGWSVQRWSSPLGFSARMLIFAAMALVVFVVNTAIAASLMFISTHDLRLLLVLCGYALTATAIPALAMGRSLGERLRAVERAAERLAAGDLSARATLSGADDIARLGRAFDVMAMKLEEADAHRLAMETARSELFAAISHDLRTPLSSFRVMVEALADGVVADTDTANRYYRTMASEVEQLSLLIDDLFELARLDSGAPDLRIEPVAIDEVISAAVDAARVGAEQAGVELTLGERAGDCIVAADPARVVRVLRNLLQNAIRHTPPDGSVVVSAADDGLNVVVAVRDTGEGIKPGDVPLVFDRFYRAERARSRVSGGSGLGLSIAKGIVEAHGGQIWVAGTGTNGTEVRFALPRTRALHPSPAGQ